MKATLKILAVALVLAVRASPQAAEAAPPEDPAGGVPRLAPYKGDAAPPAAAAKDTGVEASALMEPFQVREPNVLYFRERDINTKEGMAALSLKRHPGLLIGKAFRANKSEAYEVFLRDDWRATKSDYWDMAHAMALGGDPAEGRKILEAINDEDIRMRAEANRDAASPTSARFQGVAIESSTRLLEMPENPVNIPLVRMTW